MNRVDIFNELWMDTDGHRGVVRLSANRVPMVEIEGIEHARMSVVAVKSSPLGLVVTFHEEGRSYFSSRNRRGYAAAEYFTALIAPYSEDDEHLWRYVQIGASFEAKSGTAERRSATVHNIDILTATRSAWK